MRLLSFALFALLASGTAGSAGGGSVPQVLNGIDVLRARNYDLLAGKRVGLVTNHTGLAADGTSTIDLLFRSKVCRLVALFSPEHGIRGVEDDAVGPAVDAATGLTVHSLYGRGHRPTREMLQGVEVLVIDIQDIGARFYTYATTMAYCMEEAARAGIPFVVLDRPNPVGGTRVEGPMLDSDRISFNGYMPMPVRHGMTLGELARYFNAENGIGVRLEVVAMQGWRRSQLYWDTGQVWVNPSPNMRTMQAALLYPGVCLLERTDVSVGRGTDRPFEIVGAPWIEPARLAAALRGMRVPGVRFVPVFFTPDAGKHKGVRCGGVSLALTDPSELNSVFIGLALISALQTLYPEAFRIEETLDLLGSAAAVGMLRSGQSPDRVLRSGRSELKKFLARRQRALIYD